MGSPGDDMILLFGMPRSGTTWVGKTFDSHPIVAYRHEPDAQFRLNPSIPLFPDVEDHDLYKASLLNYCRKSYRVARREPVGNNPRFRSSVNRF